MIIFSIARSRKLTIFRRSVGSILVLSSCNSVYAKLKLIKFLRKMVNAYASSACLCGILKTFHSFLSHFVLLEFTRNCLGEFSNKENVTWNLVVSNLGIEYKNSLTSF